MASNQSRHPEKNRSIVLKSLLMRKLKIPRKKEQTIREERSRTKRNPNRLRLPMTPPWQLRSARSWKNSVRRKKLKNKRSTSNLCQSSTSHSPQLKPSSTANTASSCLANGADARASLKSTLPRRPSFHKNQRKYWRSPMTSHITWKSLRSTRR
jgi:hypothetical protein